ncbi:metal-dependent hydrolase [bacterium]|nr:metal-dependent hydrolase [bacterium]
MPTIKSLGHSCFTLSDGAHSVIFDPFLKGNPEAICGPEDVQVDAVLPSHGHSDHLGDTIEIATRLGCPVIAAFEMCMYCARFGCEVAPLHIGGGRTFDFGSVRLTQATHGSAVIGEKLNEYTGPAVGFLVDMGGAKVYFAGDTGLFGDMALIGEEGLDVAILPIGDCFTMGPKDALRAAALLRPNLVIPTHYSAFDVIQQDADAFAAELSRQGIRCEVLQPGQELSV